MDKNKDQDPLCNESLCVLPNYLKSVGELPGSLIYTGPNRPSIPVGGTLIHYNAESFDAFKFSGNELPEKIVEEEKINFLLIEGIHDTNLVEKVGEHFKIHRLNQEDVAHVNHRPKVELHENYLYVLLREIKHSRSEKRLMLSQISIFLFEKCVVVFTENPTGIFNSIIERIEKNKGKVRRKGADYLFHNLLDFVVDNYFITLEEIRDEIDIIEEGLEEDISHKTFTEVHRIQKRVSSLQKQISPLKEIASFLVRTDSELLEEKNEIYFRDLTDHLSQIIDEMRSLDEKCDMISDLYFSLVNLKTNETMKALTVISTIFLPLTFVAGVYGMNFKHMPELDYPWGYYTVLFGMLIFGVGTFTYIKKKKWI